MTVPCANNKSLCIKPEEVCDGIPHCPNATDEAQSLSCLTFAKSATFECAKRDIGNNLTVWIKATKCNGVPECANGEDEIDCVQTELITGLILAVSLIIFVTISTIIVRNTHIDEAQPSASIHNMNNTELINAINCQPDNEVGERASKELYQRYKTMLGSHGKAINRLKVS